MVCNVLGNKVFPDEVEDILLQYPGVLQARVFGQLHPFLGEIVVSELVLQDQQPFDAEDIINHCRKYLSSFKVPQRVILVQGVGRSFKRLYSSKVFFGFSACRT